MDCQSLVRIDEVFKHGIYPAKRGGLRRGCVVHRFVAAFCRNHPVNLLSGCLVVHRSATLFVLMEYCSGGTLYDRLRRAPKLTPRERFDLMLQATIGVSWLHRSARSHDNVCSKNYIFSDNTPKALLKVSADASSVSALAFACVWTLIAPPEKISTGFSLPLSIL